MVRKIIICLLYFIITLFVTTGCPDKPKVITPDLIKEFPIYIKIDWSFNQQQRDSIERSIESWRYVSNDKINIIPVWNQSHSDIPTYELLDNYNGMFMWYLSKKDPFNLSPELIKKVKKYNGYYIPSKNNNSANILVFNEKKDPLTFQNVILHELGHLLRLKHIPYVHSIMYPVSDYQTCISQWDANELCALYNCIPRPECKTSDEQFELNL
jgi:predicted Zn-dependent protease